jgi:hypothetical protein
MAGLTREQRTEREAAKAAAEAKAEAKQPEAGLIRMTKDGEHIDVHPTCVASHKAAGWKLGG